MFALLGVLAMPIAVSAQDRGRGKPTEVFVNGHDARDGRIDQDDRYDRNQDQGRRDRYRRNRNGRNGNDDGYSNYGGSFNLRQTALNAGFADGAKEGRKDRGRNERFNFRDESNFQKATRDYSSRLGNRELYQRYYREAFDHGYQDGFAGY